MSASSFMVKLKRAVWCLTLTALFFLSLYSFPVEAAFRCGKTKDIMIQLFEEGYTLFSTAIVNKGYAIQSYLDQSGNFRIIGVDKDLNSCILIGGTDWTFLTVTRI